MRRFRVTLFSTILLVSAILGGCSDTRVPAETPHPFGKEWILASGSSHGAAFRAATVNCSQCHEVESFCNQCHFGTSGSKSPTATWAHGKIPHSDFKSHEGVCNRCHTLERRYRGEPAVCHNCHGGAVPHPQGAAWLDPTKQTFHGNSSLECSVCHDPDTFCFQCHFGASGAKTPEGVTSWNHDAARTGHAAQPLLTNQQTAVCVTCHGLTKSFGLGPQFTDCSTSGCHGFVYHGVGFSEGHPAGAHEDLSKCGKCHDRPSTSPTAPPTFDGYVTGVACSACHTTALAHPPPPAPETRPAWYQSHRSAGGARADACGICHKVDGPGAGRSAAAPSCFSTMFDGKACHSNGPGQAPHLLGQAWLLEGANFHGTQAEANPAYCADCHDPNVFCSQCHFGPSGTRVPAGVTTWNHTPGTTKRDHAKKGLLTTAQQAVCAKCHQLTNSFVHTPSLTDCSTANCHPGFDYHGPSFFGQHPSRAKDDLLACQTCHDTPPAPPNFDGYVTGVACSDCHSDALAHPPPPTAVNWVTSHQTAGDRPAACAICHKADGAGEGPLAGAPSCFSANVGSQSCHAGGPGSGHPAGRLWMDKKVDGFHGDTANSNLTSCQPCHGIDYRGGTVAVSCYTCHFGPQGWKSPTGLNHVGTSPTTHRTFASSADVCNACHTTNRTYGNPPGNCHDCHGD